MSDRLRQVTPAFSLDRTANMVGPVPEPVQALAQLLAEKHGSVKLARESSGLHLYMACPQCLENDGSRELLKRHMAVNVDLYLRGKDWAAFCMKCGFKVRVSGLQFYSTLQERGIEYKPEQIKVTEVRQEYLEQDAQGQWVPKGPGQTERLSTLPENHPAIQYLRSRQFDPRALEEQFCAVWCNQENPALFYRRQPGGFRVTAQGRIVFACMMRDSRVGWQARILEMDHADHRYFWHPYDQQWVPVMQRQDQTWQLLPGFESWDPAKYWTAPGTRRSSVVMGFDAAVRWNVAQGYRDMDQRRCVLVEGPLDAGRIGPPALCLMGKTLTPGQAELVASQFHRIIGVRDNDKAGESLEKSMIMHLTPRGVRYHLLALPDFYKDPGSIPPEHVPSFRQHLESLWQRL